MEKGPLCTLTRKFKFIFKKFLKFLLIFLLNDKKIIGILLTISFITIYSHTWLHNYYLFLIGKYDLTTDALKYQNKTLKNINRYKVMCNQSISLKSQQFYRNYFYNFKHSTDLYADINGLSMKLCLIDAKKQFGAKISNDHFSLYKTSLNQNDLIKLQINNVSNGYYEPPLCLQEYLQSTNKAILDTVHKKLKANEHIIIREFLKQIPINPAENEDTTFRTELTVVIIPFLNREKNLKDLMLNLHSFMQRQFIHYKIIVAEQVNSNDPFNKGRLYNAAFKLIEDVYNSKITNSTLYSHIKKHLIQFSADNKLKLKLNCVILHDVDLIPESDFNLYRCEDLPRHLSLKIRKNNTDYVNSPYEFLIGGVLLMKPIVYKAINGFSNEYWNWGLIIDVKTKIGRAHV